MAGYAHPEVLVTTDWVAEHRKDSNVCLVEVEVDTSSYGKVHDEGGQPRGRALPGRVLGQDPRARRG